MSSSLRPLILVVAHDQQERDILMAQLEIGGFRDCVTGVDSPSQAVSMLEEDHFDLIVFVQPHNWPDGALYCSKFQSDYKIPMLVIGTEELKHQLGQTEWLPVSHNTQAFIDAVKHCLNLFEHPSLDFEHDLVTPADIEVKYKDLFDRASDAIMLMDYTTHTIIDVNEQAIQLYGYSRDEFVGMCLLNIVPREEHPGMLKNIQEMVEDGQPRLIQPRTHMKKDGSRFIVSISARVLEYGGQLVFQDIIRDETERIKREQAEREADHLRTLLQIAGGAAHEINQPLTAVISGTEMLMVKLPEDVPHRHLLDAVLKAGLQISKIVKGMETIKKYRTTPYVGSEDIVDFDASSKDEG